MSHGHAPLVILDITLDGKKSPPLNTATGAPFHGHGEVAPALVTRSFPCRENSTAPISALKPRRKSPSMPPVFSCVCTGPRRDGRLRPSSEGGGEAQPPEPALPGAATIPATPDYDL